MTTPIADGTYIISNVQHSGSYVNHHYGLPYSAVCTYPNATSNNQKWKVRNVGNNQITLESAALPGYYAGAAYFSRGVPTSANPSPTLWTIDPVSAGVCGLVSEGYYLTLISNGLLATIFLAQNGQAKPDEQRWKFQKV